MKRRTFLIAVQTLIVRPFAAIAQQASKLPTVSVMAVVPVPALLEAWQAGLRERGWIEDQNIAVEYPTHKGMRHRFETSPRTSFNERSM
jgi:hypothetical protein